MIIDIKAEEYALLQGYRSRWQQAAFSLDPLNRDVAIATLDRAYSLTGYRKPTLFFFATPHHAIDYLGFPTTRTPLSLANLIAPIIEQVRAQFLPILWTQFWRRQGQVSAAAASLAVSDPLLEVLQDKFDAKFPPSILQAIAMHGGAISDLAMLDFCMNVLGCTHTELELWQVVKSLIQDCFWHLAFEDICIVFDRPIEFGTARSSSQ